MQVRHLKSFRAVLLAGAGLAAALSSSNAMAQERADAPAATSGAGDEIEEIVITARKRAEKLQDTPVSVSAVTSHQLEAAGINDFGGVIASVPNVSFSGGVAGVIQGQIGIRGIATLVRNIGVESSVGFYVDGVYLGRPESYNQELIDVDRVEVLRGPQGALFGKNTIAGVFNITTLSPGDHVEGEARLEAGNYNLRRVQAYVMGPVNDVLAAKLAVGYVTRDGVYRHLSGGQDADDQNLRTLRGELYFTPTSQDELVISADELLDNSHPAYFQVTDLAGASGNALVEEHTPLTIDNNLPDTLRRHNYGLSLTYNHDFSFGRLTSITAARRSSYGGLLDDDQNQVDYLSLDRFIDKTSFVSQELRLAGDWGDKVNYLVGLYYADQRSKTDRSLQIGDDLLGVPLGDPALNQLGRVQTKSYAAFANVDYAFSSQVSASLGLRYTHEEKSVDFLQADPTGVFTSIGLPDVTYQDETSDEDLSPTLSVSYRFTPQVMVYARAARGFKSAAFNVDLANSAQGLSAGPESATTYEAGVKSDLFSRRLRLNVGMFTTNYDDLQVSQLLGAGVTLNNAGQAKINGVEVEFTALPLSGLQLDGSAGYIDAKYTRYKDCGVPASLGGGSTDCSGNRLVGAPKVTGRVGAEYDYPIGLGEIVARADVTYRSDVFFEATNSPRFKSDSHTLLDLRLGLRADRWDVFLWAKNATDDRYIVYSDDRSSAGVLQTTAYGEPRTYGVTLTARY
ncbi:TonB-dependent receptor [Phenylobacterium sp.]|uniref:TonB-dependent receptor n=1 Tax=Phenylobacterium sp. TaxID=1871053 RepID=UPI0035B40447